MFAIGNIALQKPNIGRRRWRIERLRQGAESPAAAAAGSGQFAAAPAGCAGWIDCTPRPPPALVAASARRHATCLLPAA
jgi:hypothetical protein